MQDFRNLDRQEWHQRYLSQAGWTKHLRQHIFKKIAPQPDARILEVGSGTGAIMQALYDEGYSKVSGVDLDYSSLAFSKKHHLSLETVMADGYRLPFAASGFDIVYCHFLLMWTAYPERILSEMQRVTRPGGWVMALAEPDYQARIDYPPPLDVLGKLQTEALQAQGVDTRIGRKLRALFGQSGLEKIETGIIAAQWSAAEPLASDPTEWTMLHADLEGRLPPAALKEYAKKEQLAQKRGERVLFIPTFYAIGKCPTV